MTPVIGVVVCFAGQFIPRDWAACDGQTFSISEHPLLYKLLGTTYGGNSTHYKLPDLRGRTAVSAGKSPFNNYSLGDAAGVELVRLDLNHIPEHTHKGYFEVQVSASSEPGIDPAVNDGFPSDYTGAYSTIGNATMSAPDYKNVAIGNIGSGAPVDTRSPFCVITHIICIEGIYPSRS